MQKETNAPMTAPLAVEPCSLMLSLVFVAAGGILLAFYLRTGKTVEDVERHWYRTGVGAWCVARLVTVVIVVGAFANASVLARLVARAVAPRLRLS